MASDKMLAGYETVDTFTPIQLYAGEKQPVTTQGVAAAGYTFGKLNGRNETYKFAVVAMSGDELVPWNPFAEGNDPTAFATGTVTFANAVPVDGDKVTINGVDVTFRDDPTEADFEIAIGASLAEAAANLKTFVNNHRNDFGTDFPITATSSGAVTTIRAPGDAGEAVTLAKTAATGANIAVSGATLANGTDNDVVPPEPVGILPHYLDTTADGYDDAVDTPYFVEGVFNFEALDLPEGTSYHEIRSAFARTGITIQKLY